MSKNIEPILSHGLSLKHWNLENEQKGVSMARFDHSTTLFDSIVFSGLDATKNVTSPRS